MLPEDKEEGNNRYERAINFYNSAQEFAKEKGVKFNWKFISMPNIGHNNKDVIPFAIDIINNEGAC